MGALAKIPAKTTGTAVAAYEGPRPSDPSHSRLTAAERLAVKLHALGVAYADIHAEVLATCRTRITHHWLRAALAKARRMTAAKYGRPEAAVALVGGKIMAAGHEGRFGAVPVDSYDLTGIVPRNRGLRPDNRQHRMAADVTLSPVTVFAPSAPLSTPAPLEARHRLGCCAPVAGEGAATLFCNAPRDDSGGTRSAYCAPHRAALTAPPRKTLLPKNGAASDAGKARVAAMIKTQRAALKNQFRRA